MRKVYLLTAFLFLQIFVAESATITSITSGNWDNKNTWDCGCIPTSTDDIIIGAGHQVRMQNTTVVNDLTINAGGILFSRKVLLTINGNYVVNGDHVSFKSVATILNGSNTTIDGNGTIHEADLWFQGGDKTILSTANLTKAFGTITIKSGITVHNYGIVSLGDTLHGEDGTSKWVNEVNSSLTVASALLPLGILDASASGNTVKYNGSLAQNIKTPLGNYYHLIVEASGTKTVLANLSVSGDFTINGGIFDLGTFTFSLSGDWINRAYNNETTGTVIFNGSTDQNLETISGECFYNLTVDKSGGKLILNQSDTVENTLTMIRGNIDPGSNKLILGESLLDEGSLVHTAGTIIGQFERWVNTTGSSYEFPVGTDDYALNVKLNFSALTGGSIIAEFIEFDPGTNGFPLVDGAETVHNTFTEGFWEFTEANSFAGTTYDMAITSTGLSSFTMDGSTRILYRGLIADPWIANGNHGIAISPIAYRTSMSILGQFALGDTTNCSGPATSTISGTDSLCKNTSGSIYSVTNTPGNSYVWTATGGSIISGQGTNSITIDWGAVGMEGNVRLVESNSCMSATPVDFAVGIHPIATSIIYGSFNVPENSIGDIYNVIDISGNTYTWTVTGGTISAGQGTYEITVDWGSAGIGEVSVIGSNGCGAAASVDQSINIYVPILSIKSGKWDDPETWNCDCVPLAGNSVKISANHDIELESNTTILNLIIMSGGELDIKSKTMDVQGDLIVDGKIKGDNVLTLSGSGSILDGIGRIQNDNGVWITNGNKTIPSGAYLIIKKSDLTFKGAFTITNFGNIVFEEHIIGEDANAFWINEVNSSLIVERDLLNTGKLVASATGNIVEYNGNNSQAIKGPNDGTYYNITVDKQGSDLPLASNVSATELTLIERDIVLGNYNLTMKDNGLTTGGSSSSYVQADGSGAMVKEFSDTGSFTFPVGDGTNYSPFTFELNSATFFGGDGVAVNITDGKHPNMSTADYITRYWTMTWSGLLSMNFNVNYTYVSADIVGSETGMTSQIWDGSTWASHEAVDDAANIFYTAVGISEPFPGVLAFTGGTGIPLPIELISFDAEINGEMVDVTWATAFEINNDHFVVERSVDGYSFYPLTIVKGYGNSYTNQNYGITDEHPHEGVSYYRLLQVDIDGQSSYSDIVSVTFLKIAYTKVKVYPNPVVEGRFFVSIWGQQDNKMKISILDFLGREVYSKNVKITSENFMEDIIIGNSLPSGLYYVVLSGESVLFQKKIIISNSPFAGAAASK